MPDISTSQANIARRVGIVGKETPYVINQRQVTSLIGSTIIGISVLILPRGVALHAQESAWIAVLLGMLIAMIGVILITWLSIRFPGQSVVGYSQQLLGSERLPWLGKVLSFPFIAVILCYWVMAIGVYARGFGEIVITMILQRTPLEVSIAGMLLLAMYLSWQDMDEVARVNELLFPLIFVSLLLLTLASYQHLKPIYLLPLFQVGPAELWASTLMTLAAYQGFETMQMFGAYVQPSQHPYRYALLGILFPAVLYLTLIIGSLGVFGYEEVLNLLSPTIELVKSAELPGIILERLEGIFIVFAVPAIFTTVGNLYFASAKLLKEYLGLRQHKWATLILFPVLFSVAMLPDNVQEAEQMFKLIGNYAILPALAIPFLFFLLTLIRNPGRRPRPQSRNRRGAVGP